MLRCGDLVLPYNVVLYEKEKESKIEIAKEIIKSLPEVSKGYILTDSWYRKSPKKIIGITNKI